MSPRGQYVRNNKKPAPVPTTPVLAPAETGPDLPVSGGGGTRLGAGKSWSKGKTYAEMYGPEKAAQLIEARIKQFKAFRHSEETKAKMRGPRPASSGFKKKWWAEKTHEERIKITEPARRSVGLASPTYIEALVGGVLDKLDLSYVPQYPVGRYLVDYYLPELGIALECDGEYWHSSPEAISWDQKRDKYLREEAGLQVVRIPGRQITFDTESILMIRLMDQMPWIA